MNLPYKLALIKFIEYIFIFTTGDQSHCKCRNLCANFHAWTGLDDSFQSFGFRILRSLLLITLCVCFSCLPCFFLSVFLYLWNLCRKKISLSQVRVSWSTSRINNYGMFHVTWTTFKFNRNQLGMVSAYVMWLWLIALLMCTLKWLSNIEIRCHKGFHLKPKAAINNTEISSLICKTILFSMNTIFSIYLWSVVRPWNSLESNLSLMTWWARWLLHGKEIMINAKIVPSWFPLNLKVIQITWKYYMFRVNVSETTYLKLNT